MSALIKAQAATYISISKKTVLHSTHAILRNAYTALENAELAQRSVIMDVLAPLVSLVTVIKYSFTINA